MKQYTHAWLAMMAMKRIEYAQIPVKQQDDAKALISWFKNYRDLVLQGSWYPDAVFKDMSSSHIAKCYPLSAYESNNGEGIDTDLANDAGKKVQKNNPKIRIESDFRQMPDSLQMYAFAKESPMYGQPYIRFQRHNLCDRCESFTESLIDTFKILTMENRGAPVVPTNNHIAMRFFILSHFIADAHMPLHCDARSFYGNNEVHSFIEQEWDDQVQAAYGIDLENERFFYDKDGYPLFREDGEISPVIQYVEKELRDREFTWPWGEDNNNTWDYMSGITQYSYLMAYDLIPADRDPKQITKKYYVKTAAYQEHFEEYSKIILADAVESIAKVWLHAWCRYRSWFRDHELSCSKEKLKAAEADYKGAGKIMETYPALIEAKTVSVKNAEETLLARQTDLDEALANNRSTKAKTDARDRASDKLKKLQRELEDLQNALDKAVSYIEIYQACYVAAQIEVATKEEEIKKYGKTSTV